ncbi:HAD-IC family P-type ATPase [Saccharopolyspora cebuensis]|uniref:HAD-IC family P-type ATPase n=1 Tax=Saccharopolyspora cebuensis TaxID=418759 RepID=A0ABV4CG49_9PSEU
MPLHRLWSRAAEVVAPVLAAARDRATTDRRTWRGRHSHLEVRGLHERSADDAVRALGDRLRGVEGVRAVEVNRVLGRVVVDHDPAEVAVAVLTRVLAEVEAEHGLHDTERAPSGTAHPGDPDALLRDAGALALSALGFGYSLLGSLLPFRATSPVVPAAVSLVDSVPWLRAGAERVLGREGCDVALAVGGAVSNGLAQRPLGVLADLGGRFCAARESVARGQAWARHEPGAEHGCGPVPGEPRPVPLPGGPVERVASTSGGAALGGWAATLAATRDRQRALAVLLAATPRAAKAGREAFAAQLTSTATERGALVLQPDALRRLDRVDTVVFDAAALLTGRRVVERVIPLADRDAAELFAVAGDLVDPDGEIVAHGGWTLTAHSGSSGLPASVLGEVRAELARGAEIFLLRDREEPAAVVVLVAELDPLAESLVEVAGEHAAVLISGRGTRLDHRLDVDGAVAGGTRLPGEVRRLQREGAVVAVVSARDGAALLAADVGIGASGPAAPVWAADVLCPTPALVHFLLAAQGGARRASTRAAALSAVGSAVGAFFAAFGPASGAPGRAGMPCHAATLAALLTGTWIGWRVAGRAPPVPRERTPWHAMTPEAVLRTLAGSREGLSAAEARRRTEPAGEARQAPIGLLAATTEALITPITSVLGAGAVVSAGLGSVTDAALICGVLLTGAVIEGVQRVHAERELSRLREPDRSTARRRRGGEVEEVPTTELVPGDVIELRAGDAVPADARLLAAESLEVDESGLTGESLPAAKRVEPTAAVTVGDRTCMVYRGTSVAGGSGSAVVVATGERTEVGRTARAATAPHRRDTGVQRRLGELTHRFLPLSIGAGGLMLAVDLLRGVPAAESVSRSVGLAVAAVPEGLPFVATLAEMAAARRLSRRGVVVRTPDTVEALGRVDALCFDKTGTLTQGRITLGAASDGRTGCDPADAPGIVAAAARACPRPDGSPLPHPTDQAILDGAAAHDLLPDAPVLAELPFEPSRGFHASHTAGLLSVKGAPEVVLRRCTRHAGGEFDDAARAEAEAALDGMARRGFRVLAIAERPVPPDFELSDPTTGELELLGFLGLADPVHPAAAAAVARLGRAGVDVMMITGDHPSTAEAIAADLDLLDGRGVLTGAELDELDDERLTARLADVAVFARVSPAQKARIVDRLRAAGRVVAMTGDGANDVPAIGLAQVGIAFGSRAAPAARESADLVVGEDRIETLTEGIVEGRGMWSSVRDALALLLGGNLGEIGYAVVGGGISPAAPLNTRQLLVVNMLTDVLPAMAIAVRPPPEATPDKLLAEGPDASLGSALIKDVRTRAVATAAAATLTWLATRALGTPSQARTAALVALVSTQLAQTVATRGRTPVVLAAGVGSMVVLAGLVQLPGVSWFSGNTPLFPHHWAIALTIAALAAVAVRLRRPAPARGEAPRNGPAELPRVAAAEPTGALTPR